MRKYFCRHLHSSLISRTEGQTDCRTGRRADEKGKGSSIKKKSRHVGRQVGPKVYRQAGWRADRKADLKVGRQTGMKVGWQAALKVGKMA
jgi:hypothetical protein